MNRKSVERSSSQDQKIPRTVFEEQRSKTPDRKYEVILKNRDVRESINIVKSQSIFVPFKFKPDEENKSIIFFADYNFLNRFLELSNGAYPKDYNVQVKVYSVMFSWRFTSGRITSRRKRWE
jgi:hypothetical protein